MTISSCSSFRRASRTTSLGEMLRWEHGAPFGIDELGYILHQEPAIAAFEVAHPAAIDTRA